MTKLQAGQSRPMNIRRKSTDDGPGALLLTLLVTMLSDGVSLIFPGNQTFNRSLPQAEAKAYLEFLKAEAANGTPLWLIEQRAGYFTSAMAVADQAEQDMVEQLTADLTATAVERQAQADQLTADARQIASGTEWQQLRQSFRKVRNTRSQAYLKPPTTAMLRLMRAHTNGIVTCDEHTNWTILRAMVDRGVAEVHTVHGHHVIESVRLNTRGYAAIETSKGIAA